MFLYVSCGPLNVVRGRCRCPCRYSFPCSLTAATAIVEELTFVCVFFLLLLLLCVFRVVWYFVCVIFFFYVDVVRSLPVTMWNWRGTSCTWSSRREWCTATSVRLSGRGARYVVHIIYITRNMTSTVLFLVLSITYVHICLISSIRKQNVRPYSAAVDSTDIAVFILPGTAVYFRT